MIDTNETYDSVPLTEIELGKRLRKDYGDIEGLAASITKVGMLHPLLVQRMDEHRYQLVVGGRRLKALQLLNRASAEVRVVERLSEDEIRAIELEEANWLNYSDQERDRNILMSGLPIHQSTAGELACELAAAETKIPSPTEPENTPKQFGAGERPLGGESTGHREEPVARMQFHEVADLLPMMTAEEFADLLADIKEHGLREAIYTYEGKVIDGRNRYNACLQAKVEPKFREWRGSGSLISFVLSENVNRRHLNAGQKAVVPAKSIPLFASEAAERQKASRAKPGEKIGSKVREKVPASMKDRDAGRATTKAARATGANSKYVAVAVKLQKEDPEEFERVATGETTISAAVHKGNEKKREARRQQNREKVATVPVVEIVTAGVKFATIVMDPPWDRADEGDVDQMGRSKPDYATMSIEKLMELPVAEMADVDCHLYLWITNRSLPKGFALMEKWGFRYITMLTWVKPSFGPGNYFRGQNEHVLFGVRGSQLLKRKDVGTVLEFPRSNGHSSKPPEFLTLVESCSPGPYLEMFSRSERPGWVTWGEANAT